VAINLQRDPAQRSIKDLSMFALRFVMGLHVVAAEPVETAADLYRSPRWHGRAA
jgi:hypothetical protein